MICNDNHIFTLLKLSISDSSSPIPCERQRETQSDVLPIPLDKGIECVRGMNGDEVRINSLHWTIHYGVFIETGIPGTIVLYLICCLIACLPVHNQLVDCSQELK